VKYVDCVQREPLLLLQSLAGATGTDFVLKDSLPGMLRSWLRMVVVDLLAS
jgi:hypothetical protein